MDGSGLMNVTGTQDCARQGQGGHNSEANAILYRVCDFNSLTSLVLIPIAIQVLVTASELASHVNDFTLSTAWAHNATVLKQAYNDVLWLKSLGMYRDNSTTTLCPEDGNSLAVLFNVTLSDAQKKSISEGLTRNWNEIGPVTPELPDTISPFIAGFEVRVQAAHYIQFFVH